MVEIIHGLADMLGMNTAKPHQEIDWDQLEIGDGIQVDVMDYLVVRVTAHRKSRALGKQFRTKKKKHELFIVRTA